MTRLCREAISIFDRADSAPLTPPESLNVAVRTLYYTYAYPISALLDSSIRIGRPQTGKNQQTPKNWNHHYLPFGKSVPLNFQPDSEPAI